MLHRGGTSERRGRGTEVQGFGRRDEVGARSREAEMLRRQMEREQRMIERERQLLERKREQERRERERQRRTEERKQYRGRQEEARRRERGNGLSTSQSFQGEPGSMTISLERASVASTRGGTGSIWEERRDRQKMLWERSRIARQERLRRQRERYLHRRGRPSPAASSPSSYTKTDTSDSDAITFEDSDFTVDGMYRDKVQDKSVYKDERQEREGSHTDSSEHIVYNGKDPYGSPGDINRPSNTTGMISPDVDLLQGPVTGVNGELKVDGFRLNLDENNTYNLVPFTTQRVTFPCTGTILPRPSITCIASSLGSLITFLHIL